MDERRMGIKFVFNNENIIDKYNRFVKVFFIFIPATQLDEEF